jgi:hypothetical protein
MKKTPADRNLSRRLAIFVEAGLIDTIPTEWQLLLGQLEMAPYVVMPDAGDGNRYAGAPLGHPLLRTPLVFARIGLEHLRVGHGLHSSLKALLLHVAYVFHEGMPSFDLQLVQSHPGGLDALAAFLADIEHGDSSEAARHRRLIDLVVPQASAYRRAFIEPGGWIDRARAFAYPTEADVAAFLRPEFTDLCRFINYCARTFPASPKGVSPLATLTTMADLSTRAVRSRLAA